MAMSCSRRTTMRVTQIPLRARRVEAYSNAEVRCGGKLWASRIEVPASRGDEMRALSDMVFWPREQKGDAAELAVGAVRDPGD